VKSIAFYVQKGGTGKTTMTGLVGAALSKKYKTLFVDGDPQGNLTSWFITEPLAHDLGDVMRGKASLEDSITDGILPTIALDGVLKTWSESSLMQKPFAFHDLVENIASMGFEVCLFDLGPGISLLEKSILAAMDEVVPVMAAEYFSVDGLEIFENELAKLKADRRTEIRADKLVINRVNRSFALHKAYRRSLEERRYEIFTVGQSTSISDCVPMHQTLEEFDPKNKNLKTIEALAGALMNGRG